MRQLVDEMFDCIVGEVIAVMDTIWRLNDNFIVFSIKGVLSMLNGKGCQEMGQLHDLVGSCDAMVLENVPDDVHKLADQIVRRWWKPHGFQEDLRRFKVTRTMTVSDCNN
jgi:hypothetical protein